MEEKGRQSWEWRSLRFVGRALLVILFLLYLTSTSVWVIQWARLEYVRRQPLDAIATVAEKSMADGRASRLAFWMTMRPRAERAEIMKRLEPLSGRLGPPVFMLWSEWALEEDEGLEAAFWRQYALFRLRFDTLRCGAPQSVENITGLLALSNGGEIVREILAAHPDILPDTLARVLEYDAKYPAENVPADTCKILYQIEGDNYVMVARPRWPAMRQTLRRNAQESIGQLRREAAEEKKAVSEP